MKTQLKKNNTKSHGPLGQLIRSHRAMHGLSLAQVAEACGCSVQFISNIEHGRAPLPWDKAKTLAQVLKLDIAELESANLAIRSDFKGFIAQQKSTKTAVTPTGLAVAIKDRQIQRVLERYHSASEISRKRFFEQAMKILN